MSSNVRTSQVADNRSPEITKPAYRRTITGLGREWSWPVGDTDLESIIFKRLPDLSKAVSYCQGRRTAIQAGAALGVWPYALSLEFEQVLAFEANRALRPFIDSNLQGVGNIRVHSTGLSDEGMCAVPVGRPGNIGATWFEPSENGDSTLVTLDGVISPEVEVDLIQLDVEGYEKKALLGAKRLIQRCSPVIMIEETGLGVRYFKEPPDAAQRLLESWGYKVVAHVHRDLILVRNPGTYVPPRRP